jgi:large conductance mechanosensitive channel
MLKEFRDFITRGNMLDLAVGVIIGGAFTALVGSLTTNLINPLLSLFIGKADLSGLSFTVLSAKFPIGNFLNDVINFIIMAFVVFLLVKAVNKLLRKPVPEEAAPTGPSEQELLTEIRDLLKQQK